MLFVIFPRTSGMPNIWHTYMVTYDSFMVIVKTLILIKYWQSVNLFCCKKFTPEAYLEPSWTSTINLFVVFARKLQHWCWTIGRQSFKISADSIFFEICSWVKDFFFEWNFNISFCRIRSLSILLKRNRAWEKLLGKLLGKSYGAWYMLFVICPRRLRTLKFWLTYVITYDNFMVIVKTWILKKYWQSVNLFCCKNFTPEAYLEPSRNI